MNQPKAEFSWGEGLAFLLSMIGVQLCSEVLAVWGLVFYSPPVGTGRIVYVAIGLGAVIFGVGALCEAFTNPFIGTWSDRARTRPGWGRIIPLTGRRRPFIFWGAVLMVFTGIAFWFPPVRGESSINFVYGTVLVCLHWFFFTVCVVPLNALGPEIARSTQARVRLGQWIAVGMILGLAVANIVPPILIEKLDPERQQAATQTANAAGPAELAAASTSEPAPQPADEETYSPRGYQRTATVFALVSVALLLLPVIVIRERYDSDRVDTQTPGFRQLVQAFRNKVFLLYVAGFFLFMIGYLAAQRALPYWAEVGLGGSEKTVAVLMAPFILSALLTAFLLMPVLSRLLSVKWLWFVSFVIVGTGLPLMYPISVWNLSVPLLPAAVQDAWMGLAGTTDVVAANKILMGAAMFCYCGIGQGIQYVVTPALLGEIIDLDEQTSGERREAIYSGGSAMAFKIGQLLSVGVAAACMHVFGNSVARPYGIYIIGPVAAVFAVLGILVVWYYPVLHVTPESTAELEKHAK